MLDAILIGTVSYLCIKKKKWSNYKTPSPTLDQKGAGEAKLKQTITE